VKILNQKSLDEKLRQASPVVPATTVNIAARVQGLSDGRDVMASGAIFAESNAAAYLAEKGWSSEQFTTSLKGLKSSYQVHKLHAPNA